MPINLKNTTSIFPWLRYSLQKNEMSIAGDNNVPKVIPFIGAMFAMDFENGSMGH